MLQLANAIAFEVGFRVENNLTRIESSMSPKETRAAYIADEVAELRANSGLEEGTRAITADHVAEAVAFKTQMYIDIVRAPIGTSEYYIVYKDTPKIASGLKRNRYTRYHDATNAVRKANHFCDKPVYEAVDNMVRLRRMRLRLVRSARFGNLVLERNDTPFQCSVASESYWQN